jgi:hypothetical protein
MVRPIEDSYDDRCAMSSLAYDDCSDDGETHGSILLEKY